ncbi:MAG TPA: class I SAM-dependent methyltransferase, partial [Acidimicrobiia bacterium]|nr:class I SAM-dependent methyltransferase [Acidimicrobiia bacterium]
YVREILCGLAAAGALEYEPDEEIFRLPPEHALFLASEVSPYFMGGWFDMLPSTMTKIDDLAEATRNGGGVGFDEYGETIIRGIDRGNAPSQRVFLVAKWLPAVPGLVAKLEEGANVADIGCGGGTAAILMAQAFPRSIVTGFDVSAESLELARSRSEGVDNVSFKKSSADAIPLEPPYDLVTAFDVIHDLADPLAALVRIRESLAPDGRFLMMEPNLSSHLEENLHDLGAMVYGISTLHCMTQSLAQGGEGLGAAWGREMAKDYAGRAGFASIEELKDITNRFSAFYLLTS